MNINIHGPINNTGYGVATKNIIKGLISLEHKVGLHHIGGTAVDSPNDKDLFEKLIRSTMEHPNPISPTVKIFHQFDLINRIGRGPYLAYPFFELDKFNELEKIHLTTPDKIIVSSEWAKNVMLSNGVKQYVDVVPLGVDRSIFNEANYKQINRNKYSFITIGKWEKRKCHDLLPEIFLKAFPKETDVEFWIIANPNTNYCSPEEAAQWKQHWERDNRLKVIPGVPSQKDMCNLIANSNCGVYVSRAEGWNLELLETMSMNRPVIASNVSSHREFCNSENSYLIDMPETELADDGKAFRKQGNWAKVTNSTIDDIIDKMRYCYKNNISINIEGLETAKQLSWENTAQKMVNLI